MLNAARAQGRPTMVMAMITAASAQPAAIQRPPKTIQRILRNNGRTGMGLSGTRAVTNPLTDGMCSRDGNALPSSRSEEDSVSPSTCPRESRSRAVGWPRIQRHADVAVGLRLRLQLFQKDGFGEVIALRITNLGRRLQ